MIGPEWELRLMWVAVAVYVLAGSVALFGVMLRRPVNRSVLWLMSLALSLHGISIGMRWHRIGHGPFITMYEVLSSNVWSLNFVFHLAFWRIKAIRPTAALVAPINFIMIAWLLILPPGDGFFPPTYDTPLLYLHIFFGKIFLGSVLVAVGVSSVILLRGGGVGGRLVLMPDDRSLEELAYRFLALGLIFETLMLITGAIWAQDAWGRYWDWDPLETWAFLTWLLLGFTLHSRVTFRPTPMLSAVMVYAVFVLAFLTFFGVPFLSSSFHKGAV